MSKEKDFINLEGAEAGQQSETVGTAGSEQGGDSVHETDLGITGSVAASGQDGVTAAGQKGAGAGEIVPMQQVATDEKEPWWLSGEIEENGVKRLVTMDDVLKADPSLKDSLKGGDFLYNILNYRQKKGLSALDPATFRTMLGKHSMDKTAKQEKRDKVRHFLADAIQPVTDVLKAAVAYGYGKAGRTFIPAGGKQEAKSLGDRLRDMERVRAAQQWDAWADTFNMNQRAKIAEEAAKRRAAEVEAARQRHREEDMEDWKKKEEYKRNNPVTTNRYQNEMKELQAKMYLDLLRGGMSPAEAATKSGLWRPKSSGSGKSKSGSGSTSKTTHYEVDGTPYTLSQLDAAVEHAWYAENGDDRRAFSDWFKTLNRKQKVDYLKAHSRVVE